MQATSLFPIHSLTSAPEAARPFLAGAQKKLGVLPAAAAMLATSPTTLEAFGAFTTRFARSALSPLEREVVIMAVAFRNECEVCVSLHTQTLQRELGAGAALVEALRSGEPLPEARLEALRAFTWAVMDQRGAVPDAQLAAFSAAGFSAEQALDVVLGVAAYTLSTYANRLTRAPLDAFLEPTRWEPPGRPASP